MIAKQLMREEVFNVHEDSTIADVMDVLVREHIHGAPVVNGEGQLVGVISQQDVFFSAMTRGGTTGESTPDPRTDKISSIMTSPAVSVNEETDVVSLCRMMARLKIHRVPITRNGKLRGLVSSLDICAAIGRGEAIE